MLLRLKQYSVKLGTAFVVLVGSFSGVDAIKEQYKEGIAAALTRSQKADNILAWFKSPQLKQATHDQVVATELHTLFHQNESSVSYKISKVIESYDDYFSFGGRISTYAAIVFMLFFFFFILFRAYGGYKYKNGVYDTVMKNPVTSKNLSLEEKAKAMDIGFNHEEKTQTMQMNSKKEDKDLEQKITPLEKDRYLKEREAFYKNKRK